MNLLLLFLLNDMLSNCLLNISVYQRRLVLPSALAREASLFSGQQFMQKLVTGQMLITILCSVPSSNQGSGNFMEEGWNNCKDRRMDGSAVNAIFGTGHGHYTHGLHASMSTCVRASQ